MTSRVTAQKKEETQREREFDCDTGAAGDELGPRAKRISPAFGSGGWMFDLHPTHTGPFGSGSPLVFII